MERKRKRFWKRLTNSKTNQFVLEKLKKEKENKEKSKESTITFEREIFDYVEDVKIIEKVKTQTTKARKKKKKNFKKLKDEDDYEEDDEEDNYEEYDDKNDHSFKGNISKEKSEFYVERKSKRNAKSEIEISKILDDEYVSENDDCDDDYDDDFE